jgi:molybdopterin-guanine dinucleotide biosynthesis protein A
VLDAVAGAGRRVVVGPPQYVPVGVALTREEPPGGGPVAAVAAGLACIDAPWVAVLAGDLPFLTADAVDVLRAAAAAYDGAIALDDGGRDQFLTGVWRTSALKTAGGGPSMKSVVAGLDVVRVSLTGAPDAPPAWFDCDDQQDVTRAEGWARHD